MDVICALTINIGFAVLNQNFGKRIQLIKVITRVIQMCAPIKAKPFHRIQNTIGVLNIFFDWIGVIQAHIATRTTCLIVVISR